MANVFAIKAGNWDDATVWDNGIVPTSADVVYTNGFTVTIDADVDVNQLRNGSNNGQLPNMCVPVMTSNTTPSGVASASVNTASAWRAFGGGGWAATGSAYTLTYQFSSPKMIKRFRIIAAYNNTPNAFTFQGSNDPTFATIDFSYAATMPNVPSNTLISPLLNNLTSCLYYRINVTTSIGSTPTIYNFDMTESTAVTNSGVGGTYLVAALPVSPATRTVTISNSSSGIFNAGPAYTTNVFQINATTGILNINHATMGNVVGGTSLTHNSFNIYANTTANCTININGNLFGDTNGGASRNSGAFGIAGAVTANIIGNLTAGNSYNDGGNSWGSDALVVLGTAGNSTINITGNILGQQSLIGGPAGSDGIILIGSNATLNITGNVTGGVYPGIRGATTQTGNINIITGTLQSSITNMALNNQGTGIVTLNSPMINTNNNNSVYSQRIRFYSTAQVQWLFQNSAGGNTVLYSAGASLGMPLTTNVRNNIQYGGNNELTGVLIIPNPSNVRIGVLTDNTTGTGEITAEDFLNAIQSSTNVSAVRLKNVSTVQTTGDQLAAFTS